MHVRRAGLTRVRRRRPIDAWAAFAVASTIVVLASVASCGKAKRSPPTLAPVGSLPGGCAVAADLDRRALDKLGTLADSLFAAPGGTLIPEGLDLRHAVEHIRLCRFAPDPSAGDTTVLYMTGTIPADILNRIAPLRPDLSRESVAGVAALGGGHLWMAHRGPPGPAGELLVTTSRSDLERALTERPSTYALEPAASFSIVLTASEMKRLIVPRRQGEEPSPLTAVQELRASLSASSSILDVRLVIGNDEAARRLVYSLQAAVGAALRKLHPEVENIPVIELQVQSGDVVGHVEFPSQGLTAMTARLAAAWSKTPHGRR